MARRRQGAIGLLVAVTVTLTACGDDDSASPSEDTATDTATDDTTTETPDGTASDDTATDGTSDDGTDDSTECPAESAGSELTVGVRSEPTGLDAYVGGSQGSQGGNARQALYDTIMQYDPETGEFMPRMAESLEPNEDGTEWTLTMRDDVTFANGNPVDAEAVEFTVDRHRAEDSTSLSKATASLIESMEIVDERTVVFTLTSPWGNFPSLLAGPVGMIIDPATFEELGAEGVAADPQDGIAGPYRLEQWNQGAEMVLTARDDYWGGPVCIETVRFTYGQDDQARFDAFDLGELDLAFLRVPNVLAQAKDSGVDMLSQVSNAGFIVQINHGTKGSDRPGEDIRVRRAIAAALDVDFIDDRANQGAGLPGNALVPESSVLYSDAIEGIPFDREEARAQLEEAMADGYDGEIQYLCNQTYSEASIATVALLEDVGFTVNHDASMTVGDWSDVILETDYDLACGSALGSDAQPWASFGQLFSGVASAGSLTGYESEAMAAAMNDLKAALTPEERTEAFAEVQRVWNEEVPSAVYGHAEEVFVLGEGVEGVELTSEMRLILSDAMITG